MSASGKSCAGRVLCANEKEALNLEPMSRKQGSKLSALRSRSLQRTSGHGAVCAAMHLRAPPSTQPVTTMACCICTSQTTHAYNAIPTHINFARSPAFYASLSHTRPKSITCTYQPIRWYVHCRTGHTVSAHTCCGLTGCTTVVHLVVP